MDDCIPHFILLDPSSSITADWIRAISQHVPSSLHGKLSIASSKLSDLAPAPAQFDCIVSPADSYGHLDGGFDYHLAAALAAPAHAPDAATTLAQSTLDTQWKGHAPPGTCTLVPLKDTACAPNAHGCTPIALCPTMRVPEIVTQNQEIVYNCVWSLLVARRAQPRGRWCRRALHRQLGSVLMTALATSVGRVPAARCAVQTMLAIRNFANARAHPDKWSAMGWDDAIGYALDGRSTYDDDD